MISILRGLRMAAEEGNARFFIPVFLELVALVCVFEAGDSARAHEYRPVIPWLLGGLIFSVVGFAWPKIRQRFRLRKNEQPQKPRQIRIPIAGLQEQLRESRSLIREWAAEEERRRVKSADWLDLADRFKEISKFTGVQLHTASREGSEVDTWRFTGEVNDTKTCGALCARGGAMLLRSRILLSERVRREKDDTERWLSFLRDQGVVQYEHGPGREEYDGGVTLHFLGSIVGIGPVSSRVCIECSAKEL